MSVKVFQTNKAGKIEFTRCELEKLLNETYNEGYHDGEKYIKNSYWTWTSPNSTGTPYYGALTCNSAIRSSDVDSITGTMDTGTVAVCDKATNSADNAISTTTLSTAAPKEVVNKISVETRGETKNGKADMTAKVAVNDSPAKTYEVKGMTYNMDDLAKTVEAILSGKSIFDTALYNHSDLNGAKRAVEDTPFSNLAKELRGL